MRNVILFIAMSLDGYIADMNGRVDWLVGEDVNVDMPDTYGTFIRDIDTVIMGWNTYYQIVTELSPQTWVYKGLKSYVLTHRNLKDKENICFTHESPRELTIKLKYSTGKDIWICGGGDVIQQFLDEDLIDMFHISIIPVLLGNGIRLFNPFKMPVHLQLVRTLHYNGIIEMIYKRR